MLSSQIVAEVKLVAQPVGDAGTHRSATPGVDEDAAFDLAGP